MDRDSSAHVKHLLRAVIVLIIWKALHLKSISTFQESTIKINKEINHIKKFMLLYSSYFKGNMYSLMLEFTVVVIYL